MTKQIQEAYIVAATRTPVGKAPRGVFRNTRPDDMLAHVLRSVVAQAPGIDVNRIDDAIIGCAILSQLRAIESRLSTYGLTTVSPEDAQSRTDVMSLRTFSASFCRMPWVSTS